MAKNVVIVEFMGSHSECIYSIIEAYKQKGYRVNLVTSNRERKTIGYLEDLIDNWYSFEWTNSQFLLLFRIIKMRFLITSLKPAEVFFNSAQGTMVRTLLQLLPKKRIIKKGFLHNTRKLNGSSTQKTISKYLSKYLVLSDFQKESAQKSTSTAIDVFYPIGFRTETEIEPTKDTLKLCVVGAMEYKKKDIAFLLEQIDWLEETGIELVIAGKIDPTKEDLLPLLNAVSNRKNITYSTTFIPDQELFKLIQQSHIVWPLIHPGEQKGNQYMTTQTSGSINMAFGFKKPLLLHKEFVRGDLLEESSITYTRRTFRETLEGLRDFDIIDKLDIRIKENKSFELSTYFKNL